MGLQNKISHQIRRQNYYKVEKTDFFHQNVIKLENKTLVPMYFELLMTNEVKLRSTVIKPTIGIHE